MLYIYKMVSRSYCSCALRVQHSSPQYDVTGHRGGNPNRVVLVSTNILASSSGTDSAARFFSHQWLVHGNTPLCKWACEYVWRMQLLARKSKKESQTTGLRHS